MYEGITRSDRLTLDELQKYNATQKNSAEGKSLIERIRTNREEVTKSLTRSQAYQDRKYNNFYHNVKYKVGQKVWLMVKNITIERPSRKLDWQR